MHGWITGRNRYAHKLESMTDVSAQLESIESGRCHDVVVIWGRNRFAAKFLVVFTDLPWFVPSLPP